MAFSPGVNCRAGITFCILSLLIGTVIYYNVSVGIDESIRVPSVKLLNEELNVRLKSTQVTQRLPTCILIGVQKGGTGALIEFLDLHPDIVVLHKEAHFFDIEERYSKGLDYYRSRMPFSLPDQVTIEKTPAYFHEEKVARRVYQMNSSLRLLLSVRNPVTRILSAYAMTSEVHNITLPPIAKILFDSHGNVNSNLKMLQVSVYHVHLSRWLQYFPRQNIHIIDAENFIADPYSIMYKIERFLGIGHKISKQDIYFDIQKGFYCMIKNNVSACLPPSKGIKHPDLLVNELEKLNKYFKPLNERFFKLADRRFNWKYR